MPRRRLPHPLTRARLRRLRNYASARAAARTTLPRALFDFIDGGADDEVTLAANEAAFRAVTFRPRAAVSIPQPGLATTVLGAPLSMPVALAPCGGSRLVHPDGERALVRAAGRAGTAAAISTASSTPLGALAAAASGPLWFQLYYPGTRDAAASLVEQAQEAGYGALFVTVDMPVRGNQERVRSTERVVPPRPTLINALRFGPQLAVRPRWTLGYVLDGLPSGVAARPPRRPWALRRVAARPGGSDSRRARVPGGPTSLRPHVTWDDVAWLRDRWDGPFVVKGVLTGDDARRAVSCGADAVVVSNHGGRQLDGAPATLRVLPEVRASVGRDVEVLLDGGVRRGADVVKAMSLGADLALVGRPYLYGLAVAGEAGVARVLDLLRDDIVRTLRLLGRPSVADLDRTAVEVGLPG